LPGSVLCRWRSLSNRCEPRLCAFRRLSCNIQPSAMQCNRDCVGCLRPAPVTTSLVVGGSGAHDAIER
jgi:hypothetical protein